MSEAARPATAADLDTLAGLASQAVDEQRDERGGAIWSRREARVLPAAESLTADLEAADRLVLAGTYHDAVVGYAVAAVEVLRDGTRLGVLRDIFVEPEAREVGVGEALVEAVLGWCREERCVGIDGLALPGNRSTKNFFESFGFVARAIVVHRPLEEGR